MVPPVRVGHHHPHLSRGVRRAAAPAPTMAPLRTRLLAALLVLALVAGAAGGDPRRGSLLSFYKPVPANTLGMPGGDAPTAPVAPVAVTPPAGEALRAYSACAARGGATRPSHAWKPRASTQARSTPHARTQAAPALLLPLRWSSSRERAHRQACSRAAQVGTLMLALALELALALALALLAPPRLARGLSCLLGRRSACGQRTSPSDAGRREARTPARA